MAVKNMAASVLTRLKKQDKEYTCRVITERLEATHYCYLDTVYFVK